MKKFWFAAALFWISACASTSMTITERFTSDTPWGSVEVKVAAARRDDGHYQCVARSIRFETGVGIKRISYMPEYIYAVDALCDETFDYISLRRAEDYELLKQNGDRIYEMLLFLMYQTLPIPYHGRAW